MQKKKQTKKTLKVRKTKNIWSNGKVWLPWGTCIVGVQGPVLSQDIYIHLSQDIYTHTPAVSAATRNHLGGGKEKTKRTSSGMHKA